MTTLILPQARIPIAYVMVNGVQTPATIDLEWMRSFTNLYIRAGGISGVSTTEIVESSFEDAGIPEAQAQAYALRDAIDQMPSTTNFSLPDAPENTAELHARITALESAIQELKQGLML